MGNSIMDLRREREKYWSASRIDAFVRCPLAYAFRYILHKEPEFVPVAICLGSAVHRCQEMATSMRAEGHPLSREDVAELFSTIWCRQVREEAREILFGEGEDIESTRLSGVAIAECFHDNVDPAEEIVALSEAAAVPLVDGEGDVLPDPLIFEIDLVARTREGEKLIVDWKSAKARWPADKADRELQPAAYVYGYEQLHGERLRFRYDIAIRNKTPVLQQAYTERDDESTVRFVELIKIVSQLTEIGPEVFWPNHHSFTCPTCGYQDACARWHRERSRFAITLAA